MFERKNWRWRLGAVLFVCTYIIAICVFINNKVAESKPKFVKYEIRKGALKECFLKYADKETRRLLTNKEEKQ